MKGLFGRLAAVVVVMGLLASPLVAQQAGNPVYVGGDGMGVTLNGDFGYLASAGDSKYVGGRATLGVSMVVINAGAGYNLDSEAASFGGNAAFNLLSLPGSPLKVGVYAGLGYQSVGGISNILVPAGAVFTISPPSAGSMGFDVWLAPGLRYSRLSGGGFSGSNTNFGGSAGVNINTPMGFGFHAAADYTNVSGGGSPFLIGGGIHYKFGM